MFHTYLIPKILSFNFKNLSNTELNLYWLRKYTGISTANFLASSLSDKELNPFSM